MTAKNPLVGKNKDTVNLVSSFQNLIKPERNGHNYFLFSSLFMASLAATPYFLKFIRHFTLHHRGIVEFFQTYPFEIAAAAGLIFLMSNISVFLNFHHSYTRKQKTSDLVQELKTRLLKGKNGVYDENQIDCFLDTFKRQSGNMTSLEKFDHFCDKSKKETAPAKDTDFHVKSI